MRIAPAAVGRIARPEGPAVLAPAAMVVARDGRAVNAHYGSVAAELAVCRKSVGLALRTELRILEVAGRGAWLERMLSRALGGRVPEPGSAAVAAGTWCLRIEAARTLVVGSSGAVERWRRAAREAVIGGSPIVATELTDDWTPVSLIGPKAPRVLDLAGLPADLSPGALAAGSLGGAETFVLRAGADHWLLVAGSGFGADAGRALLAAGRAVGLSLVGCDAVGRLAAAARPAPLV